MDFQVETNKNYQILILTLLFTTYFLQKGYFWAPFKMPTVPSSHCKRTAITINLANKCLWGSEFPFKKTRKLRF